MINHSSYEKVQYANAAGAASLLDYNVICMYARLQYVDYITVRHDTRNIGYCMIYSVVFMNEYETQKGKRERDGAWTFMMVRMRWMMANYKNKPGAKLRGSSGVKGADSQDIIRKRSIDGVECQVLICGI